MDAFRRFVVGLGGAIVRAVRWSLAATPDATPHDVTTLPGPAHGPVPAIRLRVEDKQRRTAS